MSTERFIFGAGGHARVVLDALQSRGETARLFDGEPAYAGKSLLGVEIEYADMATKLPPLGHLAIGDNQIRKRLLSELGGGLRGWFSIIHPDSTLATSAELEDGVFVAARAVVAPLARIATATIINHGAVVDHDCRIGKCCHIAPNATLGGNVSLGDGVLVGSGAVVLPGVVVGDNVIIGSGAVVTADVKSGCTVVGVPARERKNNA